MELPLGGYLLDFWAEHSGFIRALRTKEGRDPLVVNLEHMEAPDLFEDLIKLDTFQKRGGLFVYNHTTGKASINPNRPYTKRDIEGYLFHYLAVDEPSKLLEALSKMQVDRPRKLKRRNSTHKSNNSNFKEDAEINSNTNSNLNIGFINENEENAYFKLNKKNRKGFFNKSYKRKGKK